MAPIDANLRSIRSHSSSVPFKLGSSGDTNQVAQTALAWVRGQVPNRVQQSKTAALTAPAKTEPAPITNATSTAGVLGSLQTALGNLEGELGALKPHQTDQFMQALGTPNAPMPNELTGAHRALNTALERLETASGRPDYDQVHRLLADVRPPYTLSNELLGLGLGSAKSYESATQARTLLLDASGTHPALRDIRYMDIESGDGQLSTLAIQHSANDITLLRSEVTKLLEQHGITADVSYQRLGPKPPLNEAQQVHAFETANKARDLIMQQRSGNKTLDSITYMHIKEPAGGPSTLRIETNAPDGGKLEAEVRDLLRRNKLLGALEFGLTGGG